MKTLNNYITESNYDSYNLEELELPFSGYELSDYLEFIDYRGKKHEFIEK